MYRSYDGCLSCLSSASGWPCFLSVHSVKRPFEMGLEVSQDRRFRIGDAISALYRVGSLANSHQAATPANRCRLPVKGLTIF